MEFLSDNRKIALSDGGPVYIRSGTLIPNNLIDFRKTSATTWENAILNLSFAWSLSLKIGIDW